MFKKYCPPLNKFGNVLAYRTIDKFMNNEFVENGIMMFLKFFATIYGGAEIFTSTLVKVVDALDLPFESPGFIAKIINSGIRINYFSFKSIIRIQNKIKEINPKSNLFVELGKLQFDGDFEKFENKCDKLFDKETFGYLAGDFATLWCIAGEITGEFIKSRIGANEIYKMTDFYDKKNKPKWMKDIDQIDTGKNKENWIIKPKSKLPKEIQTAVKNFNNDINDKDKKLKIYYKQQYMKLSSDLTVILIQRYNKLVDTEIDKYDTNKMIDDEYDKYTTEAANSKYRKTFDNIYDIKQQDDVDIIKRKMKDNIEYNENYIEALGKTQKEIKDNNSTIPGKLLSENIAPSGTLKLTSKIKLKNVEDIKGELDKNDIVKGTKVLSFEEYLVSMKDEYQTYFDDVKKVRTKTLHKYVETQYKYEKKIAKGVTKYGFQVVGEFSYSGIKLLIQMMPLKFTRMILDPNFFNDLIDEVLKITGGLLLGADYLLDKEDIYLIKRNEILEIYEDTPDDDTDDPFINEYLLNNRLIDDIPPKFKTDDEDFNIFKADLNVDDIEKKRLENIKIKKKKKLSKQKVILAYNAGDTVATMDLYHDIKKPSNYKVDDDSIEVKESKSKKIILIKTDNSGIKVNTKKKSDKLDKIKIDTKGYKKKIVKTIINNKDQLEYAVKNKDKLTNTSSILTGLYSNKVYKNNIGNKLKNSIYRYLCTLSYSSVIISSKFNDIVSLNLAILYIQHKTFLIARSFYNDWKKKGGKGNFCTFITGMKK